MSDIEQKAIGLIKSEQRLSRLEGNYARGAERYLAAFGGIARTYPEVSAATWRKLAWTACHYEATHGPLADGTSSAKHWLAGAKVARRVVTQAFK